MKWNVRAVDWIAGVAMAGVLAAGGGLALGAFGNEGPELEPAVESDFDAGTVRADDFEGDGEATEEEPTGGKDGEKAPKKKKRPPPKGTKTMGKLPGGSPIVFPGDPVPAEPVAQPVEFVISSFNILGSTHTTRSRRFAPGPVRARNVGPLLIQHGVEIVGFQEMQNNQRAVIQNMVGDRYAMFPGASMAERESVNSIAWDVNRWEAVDSRLVDMPYFGGRTRRMPVIKLQNRSNDAQVWVANFHNPADAHGPAQRWRDEAKRRQINLANDLIEADGIPVLFTGDFNDREDVFCPFVGSTPLESANGGSNDGVCRPPVPTRIDWIFGSSVTWLTYFEDQGATVRRTTDHPMIIAHALLEPPEGTGAAQEAEEALGRTEEAQDQ